MCVPPTKTLLKDQDPVLPDLPGTGVPPVPRLRCPDSSVTLGGTGPGHEQEGEGGEGGGSRGSRDG